MSMIILRLSFHSIHMWVETFSLRASECANNLFQNEPIVPILALYGCDNQIFVAIKDHYHQMGIVLEQMLFLHNRFWGCITDSV